MAAHTQDGLGAEIVAILCIVGNFIAHNVNEILHVITFAISTGYLIWRWVRDWKKEKREQNKTEHGNSKI